MQVLISQIYPAKAGFLFTFRFQKWNEYKKMILPQITAENLRKSARDVLKNPSPQDGLSDTAKKALNLVISTKGSKESWLDRLDSGAQEPEMLLLAIDGINQSIDGSIREIRRIREAAKHRKQVVRASLPKLLGNQKHVNM